jgi:hypothetical protein
MTELNAFERAEEFVRDALLQDLKQDVDEKTIHAVAMKVFKAMESPKSDVKATRRKKSV